MKERKRRSVLQSARADGDGMRRPPGHLITRAGREEVMRKGGIFRYRDLDSKFGTTVLISETPLQRVAGWFGRSRLVTWYGLRAKIRPLENTFPAFFLVCCEM